jgi:hypothetical protein
MRDLWPTSDTNKYQNRRGLATHPKRLKTAAVQKIINRALQKQGLSKPLKKEGATRRHPWKLSHGFRKAFRSKAGTVMHHLNVELIMGHKGTGTQEAYWRPTEEEVLDDYLKSVDLLTINNNSTKIDSVTHSELEDLKARQLAIETVLKKIIADEQDWDPNNPEERKQIEETFNRVMTPNGDFFGPSPSS